jgi:hypothetical protein
MSHIVGGLRSSRFLVVLAIVLAACRAELFSQTSSPRYLVTATPIEVGLGNLALCIAVDPLDQHGVWWWEPGATDCATRSTGPDVFHGDEATVSATMPGGATALAFRLQTHSSTRPYVDVHLMLEGSHMRALQSGKRVLIQPLRNLDIPERPMRPRPQRRQCLNAGTPASWFSRWPPVQGLPYGRVIIARVRLTLPQPAVAPAVTT